MEYIQCTHCGKRYEASPQVKAKEGQFTQCTACHEKFLIAVHSDGETPTQSEPVISAGGWDPSLTMPEDEQEKSNVVTPDDAASDIALDDDDIEEGERVLAELKARRRKKYLIYGGLALLVIGGAVWGWLNMQEEQTRTTTATTHHAAKKVLSPAEQDAANPACRQAAARQWLLDVKAMHGTYNGDAFVRLLKSADNQNQVVRQACKNTHVLKELVQAATRQDKPNWIQAEINAIAAQK